MTSMVHKVVTVTLNPAVDVSMTVEHLVPDDKLRAERPEREPGGGGINVARVLHRFEVPAVSFVVVGGAVGAELVSKMQDAALDVEELTIEESTRESLAITESSTGRQYRISLPGPHVADVDTLHRRIVEVASAAEIVVVSGSLPPGLPVGFVADVVRGLAPDVTTIVDTSGAALAEVADGSATIIKPSQRELAELVGWEPSTTREIERAVGEVLTRGDVGAVVASRGPTGAFLGVRGGDSFWFRPPPVRPVSTVGAGDSMVAGITASLSHGDGIVDAVRLGVAAGTAAVLTPGTELCRRAETERLVDDVTTTTPAR